MRTIYFFLFFAVGCAGATHRPHPVVVTTDTVTATGSDTPPIPPKVGVEGYAFIDPPSAEMLETILESVEKEIMDLSSKDQWTVEKILQILRRADRAELGSFGGGEHRFLISVDRQDVFWNATIELAEILLARPACDERKEILAIFFPLALQRLEPWKQYVYAAALHFLVTRHLSGTYACVDG